MHLGIDLGTCFSSAAVLTGEQFRFVRDVSGGNTSLTYPSAIFLTEQGDFLFGTQAKNTARRDLSRFKQEFKRDLGSDTPYLMGNQSVLPQELIAKLIARMKQDAETAFGLQLDDAVLTVPASYDTHRRDLMTQAAIKAGFRAEGVTLLDEPEAAALYYDWQLHQQGTAIPEGATVLVYDLGGGTFDAALMRKQGNRFFAVAPAVGDAYCGGIDFDRIVYRTVLEVAGTELREQLAPENTSAAALRTKLQIADYCRDVKHQLSGVDKYEDILPIASAEDFVLSRADFEQRIAPIVERTLALCEMLVSGAEIGWDQVSGILMVGGSSKIPLVGKLLTERFGRPLWQIEDPKLAVCIGAAIPQKQISTVEAIERPFTSQETERDKAQQAIDTIINLAKQAMHTSNRVQVQDAVSEIRKKRREISSKELFIDLSAKAGVLVLSNDDVDILAQLNSQHRSAIRSLHLPLCTDLKDNLAAEIAQLYMLEVLDLSFCSEITDDTFRLWGRKYNGLPQLREIYLRCCHEIDIYGIDAIARFCRNVEVLCLDGSDEIKPPVLMAAEEFPKLRILSLVGCWHIRETSLEQAQKYLPDCELMGP